MKKTKWTNKKVQTKQKRTYMTKKRKASITKKKWGILAITLGLAVVIILGYSNVDSNDIRLNLKSQVVRAEIDVKTSERGQILTIKPILEPTAEQVKEEIRKQAKNFDLDSKKMLELAFCESGFNYKAKNPKSTARGVYQYLIGTWEETESAKKGIERNDYKANIREAMIDISNGESWRWRDCSKKIGL